MNIPVLEGNDAEAYYRLRLEALETEPFAFSGDPELMRKGKAQDYLERIRPQPEGSFGWELSRMESWWAWWDSAASNMLSCATRPRLGNPRDRLGAGQGRRQGAHASPHRTGSHLSRSDSTALGGDHSASGGSSPLPFARLRTVEGEARSMKKRFSWIARG